MICPLPRTNPDAVETLLLDNLDGKLEAGGLVHSKLHLAASSSGLCGSERLASTPTSPLLPPPSSCSQENALTCPAAS